VAEIVRLREQDGCIEREVREKRMEEEVRGVRNEE